MLSGIWCVPVFVWAGICPSFPTVNCKGKNPNKWSIANICPLFKKGASLFPAIIASFLDLHTNIHVGGHTLHVSNFVVDQLTRPETIIYQATVELQEHIDRLGSRARKWGMRFEPVKCRRKIKSRLLTPLMVQY